MVKAANATMTQDSGPFKPDFGLSGDSDTSHTYVNEQARLPLWMGTDVLVTQCKLPRSSQSRA